MQSQVQEVGARVKPRKRVKIEIETVGYVGRSGARD